MHAKVEPRETAATVGEVKHFINGEYVASASGDTFDNVSPVTGEVIARVHRGGRGEVDAAVRAARSAMQGEWGKMPLAERCALLHKVADGINARFDEFLEAECADTGKPYSLARHVDIPRGAANFKIFADVIKNVPTESFRLDTPDGAGAINYAIRVPKGVVAVIGPWNLPLLLMTWKVGPALACGNAVVVKPSRETPTTTSLLGDVMREAGIPDGVYNAVQGFGPETGAYLTEHPDVDAITFTGETTTGSSIMKVASEGLRDVSFELGGKNPALVFADCNMDKAIEGTMLSSFSNTGQVCLGTERVYVERPIFDEFVDKLRAGVAALKPGHPHEKDTTFGPLVSRGHCDKVHEYYKQAEALGANVVIGGGIPEVPDDLAGGWWIDPTIWTGLAEDSPIVKEEIFGPCCNIQPFDTEEEAIRMSNDTKYGLACSIWTENSARVHRVAQEIESGIIWVNCWFLRDLRTPFGGMKESGLGREGGVHSLEFYTELKNVCVKL